jgi:outer membrane protein TolC
MRYQTKSTPYSSIVKAQVEIGKLEDRLRSLEDTEESFIIQINSLLGRNLSSNLPLPNMDDKTTTLPISEEDILAKFIDYNPEIRRIKIEIERVQHEISRARQNFIPDLTAGVEYISIGDAVSDDIEDGGQDAVVAMVSVNIPLWYRQYLAKVRSATSRQKALEKELENEINLLQAKLKVAFNDLQDTRRKMDLFQHALVPKAQQALNVTQEAFITGKVDFLDLIDAQRELLEFELSYERALTMHLKKIAEIEMIIGVNPVVIARGKK